MKIKLLGFLLLLCLHAFPQASNSDDDNPIRTGLMFLDYPTNARIGAIGEIATVSSPFYQDAGLYQNPALISNLARYAGGNLSFNPWDSRLIDGLYRGELSAYFSFNKSNALAYNFTLFNYSEILLVDEMGNSLGVFQRVDYFHQFTYSHSFANGISLGGGLKYIRSNLGFSQIQGVAVKPANSMAVDLGIHYAKGFNLSEIFLLNLGAGLTINNFGSKISYVDDPDAEALFLPTTIRLGILLNPDIKISDNLTIGIDLAYQLEKLLVPTPPIYKKDENGNPIVIPGTDKYEIEKGMDPDISIFRALYQSFYDAPYGSEEEFRELIHKLGAEVRIDYQRKIYFAARIGRLIEHETKGGRDYLTWGFGAGAYGFTLDFKKINSDSVFNDDIWALTLGFRTSIPNPLFRF